MTDIPTVLQYQQGNDVAPAPDGFEQITNPLNPLLRAGSRLAHFTEGVYDLSGESHLMRLLKTLLGDAGVGGIQKQMLLVRLQQSLSGTHFFDLDAFYGTIFGTRRRFPELLAANPYSELLPASQWDEIRMKDGSYRSRVSRLSSAIHLGATPGGIEAVAEALTGIEFDVVEHWQYGVLRQHTWDSWESGTWTDMEAYTWDELEASELGSDERPRNVITLFPHEFLSPGDRFDLERAIDRIKPVGSIVIVSDSIAERDIRQVPFSASSSSEKWEIRQLVQNRRINGILPYPDEPEDAFVEPSTTAWAGYSGEAWTVLDRTPKTLAYTTETAVSTTDRVDPAATNMPPQALLGRSGTSQLVSLPEFALKPVQGIYSGRSVSDGVLTSNPYAERSGDQTGMWIDRISSEFASSQLVSSARIAQRFWTSPVRNIDSPVNEIVEVRFDEPVNVNHISFEYARFPCSISVQMWDNGVGEWIEVVSLRNREAFPYGISHTPPRGALHPYHFGSDHWVKSSNTISPITTRFIRFVMIRIDGEGPVGITGKRIPYPLGLRNIDLGYRVNSIRKVPHVAPQEPVATGSNLMGLQTRYFLQRASAKYVTDAQPTAWVCEPQPVNDAVVNLYLSVGAGGVPAIVNELWVDPVQPGPTVNVYYTLKIPEGSPQAEPKDEVVVPSNIGGSVIPILTGTRGLDFGAGSPSWVDIDALAIGGGSSAGQMWVGIEWMFGAFDNSTFTNRFASVYTSSIPGLAINIAHGLSDDLYTIFLTVNGQVHKMQWPADELPALGDFMRLIVSIGSTVTAYGSIDGRGAVTATVVPETSSRAVGTPAYDPSTEPRPADWYERQAYNLDFLVSARRYQGELSWSNLGAAGSVLDVDFNEAYCTGDKADSRPYPCFPGSAGNNLTVPHAVDQQLVSDMTLAAVVQPRSWLAADDQVVVAKLLAAGGGYAMGIKATGELFLRLDTGVTTVETISTDKMLVATLSPVRIAATFDDDDGGGDSVIRFWYATSPSSSWIQLGADVLVGGGITVAASTQSITVGALNATDDNFEGAIHAVSVATGIGVDGQPGGTAVFAYDGDDITLATAPISSFVATTGQTVTINRGATGLGTMLLRGPAFIVDSTQDGLITGGATYADVGLDHRLSAVAMVTPGRIPAAGLLPLVTKKGSSAVADRGWGFYLNSSGEIVFLASDGTNDVTVPVGTTSPLGSPWAFAVEHTAPDNYVVTAVALDDAGSTETGSVSVSLIGSLSTSAPLLVMSDGSNGTPGAVYYAAAGSGPASVIPGFSDIAKSIAEVQYELGIGSTWTVTSYGETELGTLHPGDMVVAQPSGTVNASGKITSTVDFAVVPGGTVRYGSSVVRSSSTRLIGAAMGYGAGPGQAYLTAAADYHVIPRSNDISRVRGTFLRFHPDYVGWADGPTPSIGFMGGSPDAWSVADWTPVGQFVLTRGTVSFPDVAAVGLKLEFSNLVAEPYESFLPVNRVVSRFSQAASEVQGRSRDQVAQATIELLSPNRFPDTIRGVFYDQDPLVNLVSPTTALAISDGASRDRMASEFGFGFSMATWHPSYRSPIQAEAGVHQYNVSEVQSISRTAFFVGLRTVEVRRVNHRQLGDGRVYDDTFLDADNVEVDLTTFNIEPGQMYTPESPASSLLPTPRTAVSKPYFSRRPITALQFATQETGPIQVLPDDEFRSNALVASDFSDVSGWHRSGDAIVFWDNNFGTVRVTRDPSVLDAFYAPDTPIVHPPITPVLSSGFGRTITLNFDSTGGISSPTVSVSPRGILYAAARVSAYNELSADLFLRIYGADGTTLLAETPFRPKVNVPFEVVLPYTLGNTPGVDSGIEVRVEQDGPWKDSWIMHALSAFDTSTLWEFSVDDGETWVPGYTADGDRFGVVDFPKPGTALRWRVVSYRYNAVIDALRIRPWYQHRMGAAL